MSTRGDILAVLESSLQNISVVNGYHFDIGLVMRRAFSQEDVDKSKSPAVAIVDDGIERPETPVGTNRRVTAIISLQGLIRHGANMPSSAALSELFNQYLGDIRKCIHAADLGANVVYKRFGDLQVQTGLNMIAFDYNLEILYYYAEASP